MARTLQTVLEAVRLMVPESSAELPGKTMLRLVNKLYGELGAVFPWAELGQTVMAGTTRRGQECYRWRQQQPFVTLSGVSLENPNRDMWLTEIERGLDDVQWRRARGPLYELPRFFRIRQEQHAWEIALRPLPAWNGMKIQVYGQIGPAPLLQPTDTLVFNNKAVGEILILLVVSAIREWAGDRQGLHWCCEKAAALFSSLGVPVTKHIACGLARTAQSVLPPLALPSLTGPPPLKPGLGLLPGADETEAANQPAPTG